MNNKFFALLTMTSAALFSHSAFAQNDTSNFYDNILFSEEYQQQQQEDQAKNSAAALLNKTIAPLAPNNSETLATASAPKTLSQTLESLQNSYGTAPLGLVWGASKADVEKMGVRLTPQPLEDYTNSFSAQNLPLPLKDFSSTTLVFGDSNKLYRILTRSDMISDDTPSASKTLLLYQYYFNLLAKKYKNAKQHYTQNVQNVDIEDAQAMASAGGPENNPNLLAELINGSAVLYATFEGDNVGAALAVNVDGNNQTYIEIDYQNLKILNEDELNVLEAL